MDQNIPPKRSSKHYQRNELERRSQSPQQASYQGEDRRQSGQGEQHNAPGSTDNRTDSSQRA